MLRATMALSWVCKCSEYIICGVFFVLATAGHSPRSPQSCENLQSSPHIVTSPVPMWNPPKTEPFINAAGWDPWARIGDSSFLKFQQNLQQAELAHIPNSHYGYSTLTEPVLPVLIFPNFQKCTEKWRGLLQASKSSTWGLKSKRYGPNQWILGANLDTIICFSSVNPVDGERSRQYIPFPKKRSQSRLTHQDKSHAPNCDGFSSSKNLSNFKPSHWRWKKKVREKNQLRGRFQTILNPDSPKSVPSHRKLGKDGGGQADCLCWKQLQPIWKGPIVPSQRKSFWFLDFSDAEFIPRGWFSQALIFPLNNGGPTLQLCCFHSQSFHQTGDWRFTQTAFSRSWYPLIAPDAEVMNGRLEGFSTRPKLLQNLADRKCCKSRFKSKYRGLFWWNVGDIARNIFLYI